MTDIRIILDALNELVTQKASSPFVLQQSGWRSFIATTETTITMMAGFFMIVMAGSLITLLLGKWIGLAGLATGFMGFMGCAYLQLCTEEATHVSENHWNEIADLIASIAATRPELMNALKPLALCVSDPNINMIWSKEVIKQLKTLKEASEADNKRETSAQQLTKILTSQTAGVIGQDTDTIAITDKELVDDSKPTSSSSPFPSTRL